MGLGRSTSSSLLSWGARRGGGRQATSSPLRPGSSSSHLTSLSLRELAVSWPPCTLQYEATGLCARSHHAVVAARPLRVALAHFCSPSGSDASAIQRLDSLEGATMLTSASYVLHPVERQQSGSPSSLAPPPSSTSSRRPRPSSSTDRRRRAYLRYQVTPLRDCERGHEGERGRREERRGEGRVSVAARRPKCHRPPARARSKGGPIENLLCASSSGAAACRSCGARLGVSCARAARLCSPRALVLLLLFLLYDWNYSCYARCDGRHG